jgi:protein-disulfide isomerase
VSETEGRALRAGLIGGVLGSVATAGIVLLAAPHFLGPKLVRDAIQRDPQILVDGQQALHRQQASKALEPIRAQLETPFASAWSGAEQPDLVMTYFFDYACGYCRQSNPVIDRLLAEDKGLRVVFRELPILGPDSQVAARASLAAAKAGKFRAFHDELYAAGRPNPQTIGAVAEKIGITPEMAKDASFDGELRNNLAMAEQLGATGTPLFVIGDQVINAAVPYEELKSAIDNARKAKS